MIKPFPIRFVERFIQRTSRPVLMVGLLIALPSLIFHILTGAIYPVDIEPWDKDPLEITGLSLLMSFMPAYLAMCFVATTRLNSCTHEDLRRLLPADDDAASMFYRWGKWWPAALVLALVYAFGFNIGWFSLSFDPADPRFGVSISIVVQYCCGAVPGLDDGGLAVVF